jgi:hypothetical protein
MFTVCGDSAKLGRVLLGLKPVYSLRGGGNGSVHNKIYRLRYCAQWKIGTL